MRSAETAAAGGGLSNAAAYRCACKRHSVKWQGGGTTDRPTNQPAARGVHDGSGRERTHMHACSPRRRRRQAAKRGEGGNQTHQRQYMGGGHTCTHAPRAAWGDARARVNEICSKQKERGWSGYQPPPGSGTTGSTSYSWRRPAAQWATKIRQASKHEQRGYRYATVRGRRVYGNVAGRSHARGERGKTHIIAATKLRVKHQLGRE